MMVARTPMVIAALAQTVRSDRSTRWTTFWIVMGSWQRSPQPWRSSSCAGTCDGFDGDAELDAHAELPQPGASSSLVQAPTSTGVPGAHTVGALAASWVSVSPR